MTYRTALLSLAVVSLFCGVAGAGTIVAYVPVARTTPVEGSAAPGFGSGAWQADGTGQVEYYVTPAALFGYAIQVSDIASMSYWTNKSTDGSAVDWTAYIYTAMQASGNEGSFYHSRLNSEPYFTQSNAPANTWHQWSTSDGVNSMRFYDQAQSGNFGTYTDPFLSGLQSGPYTWSSTSKTRDYTNEYVSAFSLKTATSWGAGFSGELDGFTVTLKNGDIGSVDFEAAPEPATWSLLVIGLGLVGIGRRYRR